MKNHNLRWASELQKWTQPEKWAWKLDLAWVCKVPAARVRGQPHTLEPEQLITVTHRMWHQSLVNMFQQVLVEANINKLTGGMYIDNHQCHEYIKRSHCFVHIDLCKDDNTNTKYLMIKGNCPELQPLAVTTLGLLTAFQL